MLRIRPAVRALCQRVRRPTGMKLMMGAALAGPMALMSAGDHTFATAPAGSLSTFNRPAAAPLPPARPLLGTPAPTGGVAMLTGASRATPVSTLAPSGPALASEPALASAAATAEADPPVAKYAREYGISVPLAKQIHTAAVANGIAPRTAFGLVRAESSFRTRAVSPVGAVGLTQIMPATARWLRPGTTRSDLMDPSFNLHMGFSYLRRLIDQYDGNERLALTAFNRGPGTVNRLLKRGRNPDNGYAAKVLTGKSAKHVALMNAKFGGKR